MIYNLYPYADGVALSERNNRLLWTQNKIMEFKPAMGKKIVTEPLFRALQYSKADDLIFHSDRASQYAPKEMRQILRKYSVLQSMSRRGNCYDNAVAKSFFKTLKQESGKQMFATRSAAKPEIFEYLEMHYNSKRLHSSNNCRTPDQVYRDYFAA